MHNVRTLKKKFPTFSPGGTFKICFLNEKAAVKKTSDYVLAYNCFLFQLKLILLFCAFCLQKEHDVSAKRMQFSYIHLYLLSLFYSALPVVVLMRS